MNQVAQLEYQKAQVAKVLASHGADSDYLLNAVLVAKAISLGIDNPYAWATKIMEIIEKNKHE